MARPININLLLSHPSIVERGPFVSYFYGHKAACAKIQCPRCEAVRLVPYTVLNARTRAGAAPFTGECKPCHVETKREWMRHYRGQCVPRTVLKSGYVAINRSAITGPEVPMLDAMRTKAHFVFEHRWVMAKFLGRPLTSNEMVDHMDGNKQNNDLSNLRLYVRGKQQPGSCPGHGTYYHEWQMAERRVRELEALLAAR